MEQFCMEFTLIIVHFWSTCCIPGSTTSSSTIAMCWSWRTHCIAEFTLSFVHFGSVALEFTAWRNPSNSLLCFCSLGLRGPELLGADADAHVDLFRGLVKTRIPLEMSTCLVLYSRCLQCSYGILAGASYSGYGLFINYSYCIV